MSASVLQRNNVRVVGSGPGTIVLAHGFGSDQTAWRHQEAALAPKYRLVLFDHVGAGRSDPAAYSSKRYRSLQSYASDLLELYAELKLSETVFVGHSMSGMIGLLAGIAQPKAFRKVVFLGASPRYLNEGDYLGGFEQKDVDALYEAMSANYHAWASGFAGLAMGNSERPQLTAEFTRTLGDVRPDVAVAVARLIFQSDYRAELPKLTVPTLIVQSSEDVAVPSQVGDYLAKHLPKARLVRIEARGHLPHLSAPDAVTQAILSFVE